MKKKSNKFNRSRKSKVYKKSRLNRKTKGVNRKSRRVISKTKRFNRKNSIKGGAAAASIQDKFYGKLFIINYLTPGQIINFKTTNDTIRTGKVLDINYGDPNILKFIDCNENKLGNEKKCIKINLLNIGTMIEYKDKNNWKEGTIIKHDQYVDIKNYQSTTASSQNTPEALRTLVDIKNYPSTTPSSQNTPEALHTLVQIINEKGEENVIPLMYDTIVKVVDNPLNPGQIKIKDEGEGEGENIYDLKNITILQNFDLLNENMKPNFRYFKETEDKIDAMFYFPKNKEDNYANIINKNYYELYFKYSENEENRHRHISSENDNTDCPPKKGNLELRLISINDEKICSYNENEFYKLSQIDFNEFKSLLISKLAVYTVLTINNINYTIMNRDAATSMGKKSIELNDLIKPNKTIDLIKTPQPI